MPSTSSTSCAPSTPVQLSAPATMIMPPAMQMPMAQPQPEPQTDVQPIFARLRNYFSWRFIAGFSDGSEYMTCLEPVGRFVSGTAAEQLLHPEKVCGLESVEASSSSSIYLWRPNKGLGFEGCGHYFDWVWRDLAKFVELNFVA